MIVTGLKPAALLTFLLITACAPPSAASLPPKSRAGVLDLGHWDFAKGDVPLDGEWEFHWQQFVSPSTRTNGFLPQGPSASGASALPGFFVEVPSDWNKIVVGGKRVGATGYATYILRVRLPPRAPKLAVWQRGNYTASTTFVNGLRIGSTGVVGKDLRSSVAGPRSHLSGLSEVGAAMDIRIQLSNFHYRAGGIRKPIWLGTEASLRNRERKALAYDLLLAGALLIVGVYHLFLFAIRPRDKSPLFFAIHCIGVAGRPLTTGEGFLFAAFPGPGYHFYLSLEYCTIPVMIVSFLLFLRSLFPQEFHRRPLQIIGGGAAILLALPFFLPALELSRAVGAYQGFLFLAGLYALVMIAFAVKRKREGSRTLASGCAVLYLGVMSDVLHARGITGTGQFGGVTLLVFIGLQAALLSVRYARSFRTVQTLSAELGSKNAELTRLDHLKDEFLANSSHELRTPLNGIIGISESLLQGAAGPLPDAARQDLTLIALSGRRLTNLVNDILDFSKLRHGDIELRLRPIDVAATIRMVVSLSRPLVPDKVELVAVITSDLPPALADEERLEQVLHNLVGNAIKFTKQGSVRIGARHAPDPKTGAPEIEIWVEDTGIGIPEEKQQLIFDSFTQADGSVSREYGGTGLGLSVSKKLVELHGSVLSVDSRPGRGARFFFTLPVDRTGTIARADDVLARRWVGEELSAPDSSLPRLASHDQVTIPMESGAIEPAEAVVSAIARVLVVDDDPVNLRVLRNHLRLHNYAIVEALNGRRALELVEAEAFDLVLLDVMMPGLSGYEVCRILRGSHSATELPVIMLTAKNRIGDLVAGLESGANDYLVKPFDSRELLARTKTMVEFRHAALSQAALASLRGEMEMARAVQMALIPKENPKIAGLAVALRYRAMEEVGGDYVDFLQPSESELGVFVGDVTGHGMPAALIVSLLKTAFYFQRESASSPAVVLNSINTILRANIQRDFVTAAYAYVDVRNRVLKVSNAGHPPIFVWRRSESRLIELRPKGRPLGVFDEVTFLEESIPLHEGDRIVLYTDGIFEAWDSRSVQFGMDRFQAAIGELQDLTPAAFADEINRRVAEWCGGANSIQDDIALVVVDVTGT